MDQTKVSRSFSYLRHMLCPHITLKATNRQSSPPISGRRTIPKITSTRIFLTAFPLWYNYFHLSNLRDRRSLKKKHLVSFLHLKMVPLFFSCTRSSPNGEVGFDLVVEVIGRGWIVWVMRQAVEGKVRFISPKRLSMSYRSSQSFGQNFRLASNA
jgi:hypothetical protein